MSRIRRPWKRLPRRKRRAVVDAAPKGAEQRRSAAPIDPPPWMGLDQLEPRLLLSAVAVEEFRVNGTVPGQQEHAAVAMAPNGTFVVVWQSRDPENFDSDIYMQRFDAQGNTLGKEQLVNTRRDGDQGEASVGVDAGGNIVVVWSGPNFDVHGEDSDIYMRRFDAEGLALDEADIIVNESSEGWQGNPDVAVGYGGELAIAWEEGDGSLQIRGAESLIELDLFAFDMPPAFGIDADLAINESGQLIAAWSYFFEGLNGIEAQQFDIHERAFSEAFEVVAFGFESFGSTAAQPAVAVNNRGDFVVGWAYMDGPTGMGEVQALEFNANASPIGQAFRVNDVDLGLIEGFDLTLDNAGNLTIVYAADLYETGLSGEALEGESNVYVREFPADARGSGEEKILSKTTEGAQVYPVIAGDGKGRLAAAWAGFGEGDDHGVFAALFGPEGQDNRPPIITELDGDRTGREGDTFQFQVLADDPDSDDPLFYAWDFGDGNTQQGVGLSQVSHVYADDSGTGTFQVSVKVLDSAEGVAEASIPVDVNNASPLLMSAALPQTLVIHEEARFFAEAFDRGAADTITYIWNFGDDTPTVEGQEVHRAYAFAGDYTIVLTMLDDDGGITVHQFDIEVINPPVVIEAVTADTTLDEGQEGSYSVLASGGTVGGLILTVEEFDHLDYTWDFGDGTAPQTGANVTHTFADEGVYTVTVTVADRFGSEDSQSFDVEVANVAPQIETFTGDSEVNEGAIANFAAAASDPGVNDELAYTWDFGDDSDGVIGPNATHTFTRPGDYTVTLTVTDGDGGSTTSTLEVTVNNVNPTIVEFTAPEVIGAGELHRFAALATDPNPDAVLTYTWDFGDGSEQVVGNDVEHAFEHDGEYLIVLTVTDKDGGIAQQSLFVEVSPQPVQIIEATGDQTLDEGQTGSYTVSAMGGSTGGDTIIGEISITAIDDSHLTYTWDFGDGSDPVSGAQVQHTFADEGVYTVTVTASDQEGNEDSRELEVTVSNVDPVIDIFTGDAQLDEGETGSFAATASDVGVNDTLTYTWDFGDGSPTATGANVTHAFADEGVYTVTLTVTDDDGGEAVQTLEVTVSNVDPVIDTFTGDAQLDEGETGSFAGAASDAGVNDTLTYTWDFGDGSPTATGANVTHAFADEGVYTVTLTVSDGDGGDAVQTLEVTVANVNPVVEVFDAPAGVQVGESAAFNATASDAGVNDTLVYTWNFGDDTTATGASATHTYLNDGEYLVTLTVTDGDEGIATQTQFITVAANPVTITEMTGDQALDEGEPGSYSAAATGGSTQLPREDEVIGLDHHLTYEWDFGDGSDPVFGQDVAHTFADNGDYTVTLTVSDALGSIDTQTLEVTVSNVDPVIDTFTGDAQLDEGETGSFAAAASDAGVNDTLMYTWDFGDGSPTATGVNVTHAFADEGVYTVTLTVTDGDGGDAVQTLEVTVGNVNPVITSLDGDTSVDVGSAAAFNATATDAGDDTLTFSWDFGDGSPAATGASVAHSFVQAGQFTVTLTVTDGDGGQAVQMLDVTANERSLALGPIDTAGSLTENSSVSFSVDVTPGTPSLDGDHQAFTYAWTFGDGSATAFGPAPAHTYANDGVYTVSVTVTDGAGRSETQMRDVVIANATPQLDEFNAPDEALTDDVLDFSASASDVGLQDILSYAWDFGDGSALAFGKSATHAYTAPGEYTVTLTVDDGDGGVLVHAHSVEISAPPPDGAGNSQGQAANLGTLFGREAVVDMVGLDDPTDYFQFRLAYRSVVDAALQGLSDGAELILRGPGGGILARSGSGTPQLQRTLSAGTYFAQIVYTGAGIRTAHELVLTADAAGATPGTALNVGAVTNLAQVREFMGDGDAGDLFAFKVNAANDLLIHVADDANVSRLTLLDSKGQLMRISTTVGGEEQISLRAKKGSYYVRVEREPGVSDEGNYDLSIAVGQGVQTFNAVLAAQQQQLLAADATSEPKTQSLELVSDDITTRVLEPEETTIATPAKKKKASRDRKDRSERDTRDRR